MQHVSIHYSLVDSLRTANLYQNIDAHDETSTHQASQCRNLTPNASDTHPIPTHSTSKLQGELRWKRGARCVFICTTPLWDIHEYGAVHDRSRFYMSTPGSNVDVVSATCWATYFFASARNRSTKLSAALHHPLAAKGRLSVKMEAILSCSLYTYSIELTYVS